jgi:hypothetical protein
MIWLPGKDVLCDNILRRPFDSPPQTNRPFDGCREAELNRRSLNWGLTVVVGRSRSLNRSYTLLGS